MPRAVSADTPTPKLGYIFGVIFLTLGAFAAHIIVPWAIVIALHWPVDLYDLFKTSAPEGKYATVWQGKLCVPSMLVSPTNQGVMQLRLTMVDLKTKAMHEIDLPGLGADLKLVQDGSVLWGMSGSEVVRIEGDTAQRISTGITPVGVEHPFLYDGKLAVIRESKNVLDELPKSYLHVWTGAGWKNIGQVLLPPIVDKEDLIANAGAATKLPVTVPFDGAADIVVVNFEGRPHLFCSDGTTVLYSSHLELIPVDTASAIAPENAPATIPQWMFVGLFANFQAGADAQGLLVIDPKTSTFQGPTITSVLRLVDGPWKEVFEITEKGYPIERTLATGDQKAYLVTQTFRDTLSVAEIEGNSSTTSQVAVNSGTAMNRFQKTMPYVSWVGWVVLLIYALLVTRLMNSYCTNLYEYGDMTVELASFVRRALAKAFDLLLIFGPIMLAQWILIGSQEQQKEWYAELFGGAELQRIAVIALGFTSYLLAWLVGLAIAEGFWGVSPGKWLLGLRVLGTTLRPCGFFRAALREIFMIIDGFFCCSWMVGAFSMTLTSCRQRLGDLISDTIVVRNPGPKT